MDAVRRGIWCFYLSSNGPGTTTHPEQLGLHARMEVCGYPLGLVANGSFEPVGLFRNRPLGPNAINTPTSSSSTGSSVDVKFSFDGKAAPIPNPDFKGYSTVPVREIYEFFIKAVLSSLTAFFCRNSGAILLNHRTVLLPPTAFASGDADWNQLPKQAAVGTFRTHLTTTGSFLISLHVSLLHGMISSADVLRSSLLSASSTVLAAPFGTFGTLQGVIGTEETQAGENGSCGQYLETQVTRMRQNHTERFTQWKNTCYTLLQMKGMSPSLLDGSAWLNIHFTQRKPYDYRPDGKRTPLSSSGPTAPWPAVLCFRKPKLESMADVPFEKALNAATIEKMDPLNKAKVWCQGVSEREEALAKRKKEREITTAQDLAQPADQKGQPQTNGLSPMGAWRPANGTVAGSSAGAMYPTPPDGVQQIGAVAFDAAQMQSPAGQLPSNNIAGVGDQATQVTAGQAQGQASASAPAPAAVAEPTFNSTNFPEENYYGDLGENLFEGNELTEADFENIFDEQPTSMDLDMPMLDGEPAQPAVQNNSQSQGGMEGVQMAPSQEEQRTKANPLPPVFAARPDLSPPNNNTLANQQALQQINTENFNRNSAIAIKRHPSPFNPETVFKRICAVFSRPPPVPLAQRSASAQRSRCCSVFEPIEFDPALALTSKGYGENGPFDYRSALKDKENDTFLTVSPASTSFPTTIRQRKSQNNPPPDFGSILAKLAAGHANGSASQNDVSSDSESSTWTSDDEDAANDASGRASSPAKSSVLQRRRPDDDVVSIAASFRELDHLSADSPGYGPVDIARLSTAEIPELSLSRYFADPEPAPLRLTVSDADFITVAQILTEQAASGFLKLPAERPCSDLQDARRSLVKAIRYSVRGLHKALPRTLAGAVGCQLRPLAEVQDVPLMQPIGRVQVRANEVSKSSIFSIPVPHVELKRYDSQLSVLPSAVSFWETLGLGPVQGPKDIVAVCVVPQVEGMRENAAAFLDRVQSTYEVLRLGSFDKLPTSGNVVDGLVLLVTDQDIGSPGLNMNMQRSAFSHQMANVALACASAQLTEKNIVVFFAYTPENPGSIVDACSAFQELFEHYKRFLVEKKKPVANELALQLIPLDYIVSETGLAVLTPSECARLCIETYDRCTLFGGPMPSPAILLEMALPRAIDFKLAATPSPNLLRENQCIHVAYARSIDERWVTAAWTDNRGSNQAIASYCLGRRGRPLSRPFSDVVHEIWETTQDIISTCKVHWRVIITKCGPMDPHEIELWAARAQAETRSNVSLVLLTVDTDPSLQLIPPAATIPASAPSVFYSTPVSTPQPVSSMSPGENPPTPSGFGSSSFTPGGGAGESSQTPGSQLQSQQQQQIDLTAGADGETTLIDPSEMTHGVLLSHRLNNSPSLTDLNPALASGYLIKRGGPRPEDLPVVMEVNVVYSDPARTMYDVLLREMLIYFRGLGTLARVRGVVRQDGGGDVRPWHVAVVEKAVRAVYLLM